VEVSTYIGRTGSFPKTVSCGGRWVFQWWCDTMAHWHRFLDIVQVSEHSMLSDDMSLFADEPIVETDEPSLLGVFILLPPPLASSTPVCPSARRVPSALHS
jgi:hypothetical protein